ncbi:MAG TPA: hypothetical protein GX700_11860 [Paracoccus sp.]|nr:hypothetical protein [Paracoccus sp. (in: a-proteobacteria)]
MYRNRQMRDPAGPAGAGRQFVSASTRPQEAADIEAMRPIRSVLTSYDYWQLQEHRRRFTELGGAFFSRLAQFIRAKMADAHVPCTDDLPHDAVTGSSRVCFALNGQRPQTATLYHWGYPEDGRSRLPVGSFLGVALIGMIEGQHAKLPEGDGIDAGDEVTVLAVHNRPEDAAARYA